MIFPFEVDEYIGTEKIAKHNCRAVLIADRTNDPMHRNPNPEWIVDRTEIEAPWSGKWVEIPKYHRLRKLAVNALYRESDRMEQAWVEFLRAEQREYEPEVA